MQGKVYAVFGATGGIGKALSQALVRNGATVALIGRDLKKLETLKTELSQPTYQVDPLEEKGVELLISQLESELGPLDGVANCIGSFFLKPIHLTTLAEFQQVLNINLISSFCIAKASCHAMAQRGSGSAVFCSSTAAITGLASHEAISAAKGGLASLVRSLAASYATKGVRINAVAPGLTDTAMTAPITSNPAALKASIAFHPMGRIGRPENIAEGLLWLLSEKSSWVTGEVLQIDGGLSSLRTRIS